MYMFYLLGTFRLLNELHITRYIVGAISLNLDNVSWTDQMPQTVRQSMRSVPDESPMKLPPPESQSSIRKKRKLTKK